MSTGHHQGAAASGGAQPPLFSDYADDPDMLELVEMFVDEMPERIRNFEQAVKAADIASITRLAHQLKGAAGGYGFGTITDVAGELERKAKDQGQLEQISGSIDELLSLCRRASSAPKG